MIILLRENDSSPFRRNENLFECHAFKEVFIYLIFASAKIFLHFAEGKLSFGEADYHSATVCGSDGFPKENGGVSREVRVDICRRQIYYHSREARFACFIYPGK